MESELNLKVDRIEQAQQRGYVNEANAWLKGKPQAQINETTLTVICSQARRARCQIMREENSPRTGPCERGPFLYQVPKHRWFPVKLVGGIYAFSRENRLSFYWKVMDLLSIHLMATCPTSTGFGKSMGLGVLRGLFLASSVSEALC